jgi:hypothetical protein
VSSATTKTSCDVVYLILSHANPPQVVRLVNRLLRDNGAGHVVVHHDYRRSHLDASALARGADVLSHTQGITWGSFELVLATLRSLAWIEENLEYKWLVFISGQDYPLRPLPEIQEFLLQSDSDGFIAKPRPVEYRFRDDRGGRDSWSARYFYRYYRLPPLRRTLSPTASKVLRNIEVFVRTRQPFVFLWPMAQGEGMLVGLRSARHPFRDGFDCYCGSQWFTLSRRSVRAVLAFATDRPDILEYYRRTFIPDESFFNSLLMSRRDLRIRLDSLRYVRMAPPWYAHPETLRLVDFEPLTASGSHFARKFDTAVDTAILDALDRHLDAPPRGAQ